MLKCVNVFPPGNLCSEKAMDYMRTEGRTEDSHLADLKTEFGGGWIKKLRSRSKASITPQSTGLCSAVSWQVITSKEGMNCPSCDTGLVANTVSSRLGHSNSDSPIEESIKNLYLFLFIKVRKWKNEVKKGKCLNKIRQTAIIIMRVMHLVVALSRSRSR